MRFRQFRDGWAALAPKYVDSGGGAGALNCRHQLVPSNTCITATRELLNNRQSKHMPDSRTALHLDPRQCICPQRPARCDSELAPYQRPAAGFWWIRGKYGSRPVLAPRPTFIYLGGLRVPAHTVALGITA